MTIYKFADAYCTTCKTITKQNDNTSLFVCQKCNTKNSPLNFDGTPHPISWKKKEDIPALKYSVLNTDCMTKDQVITALDNEISTWKSLLESNKKEDIPATYSELKHYLSWAERWMFRLLETNPELFRDFDRNRMAKIRELTNDNGHHEIDQIFRSGKEDIQPVLRWVKAEERLPDERPGWSHSADVNILLRNVKDETHPLFVSTGAYRYLGVKKWCEYLYGDRLDKGDFEVVAWQPLPAAELSPSQDVPKSEELGNIRKQSLIELMEADQRDGIYGVGDKERLYEFAKFMNQWQSENEQWNERELRNIINDFVAQNTTKEPVITQADIEQIIEQHCNQSSREAHYNAAEQIYKLFKPYLKSNSEPAIEKDTQIEKALIEIRGKLVYNEFTRLLKEHLGWHPTELRMSSAKYFVEKGSITGGFFEAIRNIAHQYSAFVLEQPLLNKYKNEQLKSNSEPVIDWEAIEKELCNRFYWTFNPKWLNWLKSNLSNYIKQIP